MPIGNKVDSRMELVKSQIGAVMEEVKKIPASESMFVLVEGIAAEPILQNGNKENTKESSSQGERTD